MLVVGHEVMIQVKLTKMADDEDNEEEDAEKDGYLSI